MWIRKMESFSGYKEKQKLLTLALASLLQGINQFANGTDNFTNKMFMMAVFSWIDLAIFLGLFKK